MSDFRIIKESTIYVKKRGGGERAIPPGKWYINRNTPVGEDAEIWERMPHNGRREIFRQDILRVDPQAGR